MLTLSDDICNALLKHITDVGDDVFERQFLDAEGNIIATVMCIRGPDASDFTGAMREWLIDNGYKRQR
jgi:hypothetical protein